MEVSAGKLEGFEGGLQAFPWLEKPLRRRTGSPGGGTDNEEKDNKRRTREGEAILRRQSLAFPIGWRFWRRIPIGWRHGV
jgi:hypothetical protein